MVHLERIIYSMLQEIFTVIYTFNMIIVFQLSLSFCIYSHMGLCGCHEHILWLVQFNFLCVAGLFIKGRAKPCQNVNISNERLSVTFGYSCIVGIYYMLCVCALFLSEAL